MLTIQVEFSLTPEKSTTKVRFFLHAKKYIENPVLYAPVELSVTLNSSFV